MSVDHFISGTVGGAAGLIVGYPLDLVKLRLQTHPELRGFLQCAQCTFRNEGVRGFFKGMAAPLSASMPVSAWIFGVYGNVLRSLSAGTEPATSGTSKATCPPPPPRLDQVAAAGAVAGGSAALITTPTELVKIRLQNQMMRTERGSGAPPAAAQEGSLRYAARLARAHGVGALYRGFTITATKDCLAGALYFALYRHLQSGCQRRLAAAGIADDDTARQLGTVVGGAGAGSCAWAAVHPLDVVKSRLQAADGAASAWQVAQTSLRLEGPKVFTRGLLTNTIRAVPCCATSFFVYEHMQHWLNHHRP